MRKVYQWSFSLSENGDLRKVQGRCIPRILGMSMLSACCYLLRIFKRQRLVVTRLRTEDKITSPHGDLHGRSDLYLRYEVLLNFAGKVLLNFAGKVLPYFAG